jgi:hypothetical protein
MTIDWGEVGIAVEIAFGGISVAALVVRKFWTMDLRLKTLETKFDLLIGGRNAQSRQRHQSFARVNGERHAGPV